MDHSVSGLFVIGERPGPEECDRGDAFVGRSGDWLNAGLAGERRTGPDALRLWPAYAKPVGCLGCPLYDDGLSFVPGSGSTRVFVSNVRRCLDEAETPEAKKASMAQCARTYLAAELERMQPTALALVGGDALEAVTGLHEMQKFHGSVWHRAEIDEIRRTLGAIALPIPASVHTIVASLHPAFAMRLGVPQLKPSIVTAVARAKRWSERPGGPTRDWTFSLEPSVDDFAAYLDVTGKVILDIETDRDDHTSIQLVGVSARDGHAMVIPWSLEVAEVLLEAMQRTDMIKIGHNFAFDRKGFAAHGIEVAPPTRDTIQAAALLHPVFKGAERMRWLNLPTCAIRLIDGIPNWKDPERPETRAWFRAAFPRVPEWLHPRLYCGVDCVVTRMLEGAQEDALMLEGMA